MLKLYISNRIEHLSERFAEENKTIPQFGHPMQTEWIVSQTSGMERWLSIETARHNGIFTRFRFVSPNGFVNQLYQLAGLETDPIYSTENLKWVVYQWLNHPEFISAFEHIANYYKNDDSKRLQLAVRLSDLFDQYLLYRQDYVEAWNRGLLAKVSDNPNLSKLQLKNQQAKLDTHQTWQAWIWQRIKQSVGPQSKDKVQLKHELRSYLIQEPFIEKIKSELGRVSLFGLSVITDYHIEILDALSDHIDIHLYFLNPSPETYWYDIVNPKFLHFLQKRSKKTPEELKFHVGNELLSSFSGLARDTFNILFDRDKFIDAIDERMSVEPQPINMLGKIQNQIYWNKPNAQDLTLDDYKDQSLIISSSYTIVREVEALYHQLLYYFSTQNDLEPHDIIVQVSDIDAYTPFIRAVFENAPHYLPFSIADRTYGGGDSLIGALEQLLMLDPEDFSSETIIQLLSSKYIAQKFELSHIALIREAVLQAQIRFGFKGFESDDTQFISWQFGLERILLGYAIQGSPKVELASYSTYPLDITEGQSYLELLRFKLFVDRLMELVDQRTADRDLLQWTQYTHSLIDLLLWEDEETEIEQKYIRKQLESLSKIHELVKEPVSYDVFKRAFIDALFSNPRAGNFMNGQITFSSMIPMRSIPFKIVAMLGLNSDAFPRKVSKLDFNLMEAEYRRGDRNPKNNDKYLFLENLMSARRCLYLSYIGHSTQDNTEMPSSGIIDELKTYIIQSTEPASRLEMNQLERLLVRHHPLQAYSQKYRQADSNLVWFNLPELNFKKPERTLNQRIAVPIPLELIDLNDLMYLFKDGYKYYYNRVLGLYYQNREESLPEQEMFETNRLDDYQIKQFIIHNNRPDLVDFGKKNGLLPLSNMGLYALDKNAKEVNPLIEQIELVKAGYEAHTQHFELKIDQKNLRFSSSDIYNEQLLWLSMSKSGEVYYSLAGWVIQVMLVACSSPIKVMHVGPNLAKPETYAPISKAEAIGQLKTWIQIYEKAQSELCPFLPKLGYDYMDSSDKTKAKAKLISTLKKVSDSDELNNYNYNIYLELQSGNNPDCFSEAAIDKFIGITQAVYGLYYEKN